MTRRPPTVAAIRALQRRQRIGLWRYIGSATAATALTAPVIYSLLLAFALLDAWVTVYQAICFRAWRVKRVRRRDFFAIDRHKLAYLNELEKLNCLYCSYANGVIAYVARPSGQAQAEFLMTGHAAGKLVFENPQHDFPQRIEYRYVDPNAITATIQGPGKDGRTKTIEYPLQRAECKD